MEDILNYYGGEWIRDFFEKYENGEYIKLLKIGRPYIIKFDFKYDELTEKTKKDIKSLFCKNIVKDYEEFSEEKWNRYYELELRIRKRIPADRIRTYYTLDKNTLEWIEKEI